MLGMIWLTRIPSRCTSGGSRFMTMLTRFWTLTTATFGFGARLEVDADRRLAGAGGVGGDVAHVLHAVDGLFQRDQDRIDQDFGAGARDTRWRLPRSAG